MDPANDAANLRARGMLHQATAGDHNSKTALELYEELRLALAPGGNAVEARSLFETFWRCRQDWMYIQMREWLNEALPPEVGAWLTNDH